MYIRVNVSMFVVRIITGYSIGVRPICQHNFGNNRMLKESTGIIDQIEIMQHFINAGFAKNTQHATKFFNSEVRHTWISSFLLKFKATISYYLLFYKDFVYLSKKLLN